MPAAAVIRRVQALIGITGRKAHVGCYCCGDFDILLVPEIVVGNVLGKCLTYTCGGRMAGIVMGCKVPIVLTSRGSSAEEKYYSLAMGAGFVG